jgi:hypothetical protein
MLDQFLSAPINEAQTDRGAFQLAWRPVGARPLSAALSEETAPRTPVSRPPLPSFELL